MQARRDAQTKLPNCYLEMGVILIALRSALKLQLHIYKALYSEVTHAQEGKTFYRTSEAWLSHILEKRNKSFSADASMSALLVCCMFLVMAP